MLKVTGTVGASGKYLVSGSAICHGHGCLKMVFENKTSGTNLSLHAGLISEFNSGAQALRLSDSGGPGFAFLVFADVQTLAGKFLYVMRDVGTGDAVFELQVE
ncbi:MAG: hypothetical protein JOZ43_08780 [Acidobacteriales bacterium]|nr:hypothetical protein [Terriglobales bacterium]